MKRIWLLGLIGLLGLCLGVVLNEARHRASTTGNRNDNEVFQERLRCKTVADDFVRKSDNDGSLFLEKVGFSPARHSCIGSFTRITTGKRAEIWSYETIDILTGETLFSDDCIENDPKTMGFCGNGRDMKLKEGRDNAFEAALSTE